MTGAPGEGIVVLVPLLLLLLVLLFVVLPLWGWLFYTGLRAIWTGASAARQSLAMGSGSSNGELIKGVLRVLCGLFVVLPTIWISSLAIWNWITL